MGWGHLTVITMGLGESLPHRNRRYRHYDDTIKFLDKPVVRYEPKTGPVTFQEDNPTIEMVDDSPEIEIDRG